MLTPPEVIELSARTLSVADTIRDALAPDGPGGKKITRAEGRVILRQCLELALSLARDIAD